MHFFNGFLDHKVPSSKCIYLNIYNVLDWVNLKIASI